MDGWCFAIVNNKLAEIYFEKSRDKTVFFGHCYIKKGEYKTKKEQEQIKIDTSKFQFIYRQGKYKNIDKSKTFLLSKPT